MAPVSFGITCRWWTTGALRDLPARSRLRCLTRLGSEAAHDRPQAEAGQNIEDWPARSSTALGQLRHANPTISESRVQKRSVGPFRPPAGCDLHSCVDNETAAPVFALLPVRTASRSAVSALPIRSAPSPSSPAPRLPVGCGAGQQPLPKRPGIVGDSDLRTVPRAGQPFIQLRPAPASGGVAHRDGHLLLLALQHHQLPAPRDTKESGASTPRPPILFSDQAH